MENINDRATVSVPVSVVMRGFVLVSLLLVLCSSIEAKKWACWLTDTCNEGETRSNNAVATSSGLFGYHGGAVISNVKVITIYWGGRARVENSERFDEYYKEITDSSYMDWLHEVFVKLFVTLFAVQHPVPVHWPWKPHLFPVSFPGSYQTRV